MKPGAVATHGFEQRVGANDVGVDEGARVIERVVVVALGREMHDGVGGRDELVDERRIDDVALHKRQAGIRKSGQRLAVAGVGELVEHRHVGVGVPDHVVNEVRADEAGSAGDE